MTTREPLHRAVRKIIRPSIVRKARTLDSRFRYHFPGEIPSSQPTLFEYFFDSKKLLWVPWIDVIPEYVHDPEKKFSEILVPTVDTVRTTWLLELMVRIKRPVVLVGETGTSKSATTANFLRGLDKDSTVRMCL